MSCGSAPPGCWRAPSAEPPGDRAPHTRDAHRQQGLAPSGSIRAPEDLDASTGFARITIRRKVEWRDTDASGHYHYGAVIGWIEAAEAELHERLGIVNLTFGQTPRTHVEMDFLAPLWFPDAVDVELEVVHVGRSSARYRFAVRQDDTLAVRGSCSIAFVPRDAKRAQPWPEALRQALRTEG